MSQSNPTTAAKPARGRAGGAWCDNWLGVISVHWKQWTRTIITIQATPRQIALGVAVGIFIAFTPLIGVQMLLAALAAGAIGASRKAAALAVWISNPMTMGPLYALTYQLGLVLGEPSSASAATLTTPQTPVSLGSSAQHVGPTFESMIQAGSDVIAPMFLGGAVLGLIAAMLSYTLTIRAVRAYQSARPAAATQSADSI